MIIISSADNKIYKDTKKLLMHSRRGERGLFIAEGERIVFDALESGAAEYIAVSESYGEISTQLPVYRFADRLFEKISDTKTTQGIIAVCSIRKRLINDIDGGMVVICDGVSDPGNLGTIIRTAECAGAVGAVLLDGCADPYNPKTVRSTMGSIFRLPIYFCNVNELAGLDGYDIVAAMPDGAQSIYDTVFGANTAVIIGNEAHGISDAAAHFTARRITIPMAGGAESLNAAVAAGIIMFEVKRQRSNI